VVRGQNLDNKGLTAILSMTPGTACALTIFYFLLGEHKVRRHTTGAMAVDFRVDRPSGNGREGCDVESRKGDWRKH
jgi:hypothetical protein